VSSAVIAKWLLLSGFVGALPMDVSAGSSASPGPLSDPTRPSGWQQTLQRSPEEAQGAADSLRLHGIFQAAGRRTAVINGQRVGVGDAIAGGEVITIDRKGVTLLIDGEPVELATTLPAVKSPAQGAEGEIR
jgi:hypothetical protein